MLHPDFFLHKKQSGGIMTGRLNENIENERLPPCDSSQYELVSHIIRWQYPGPVWDMQWV
jgi:hypothetical protein